MRYFWMVKGVATLALMCSLVLAEQGKIERIEQHDNLWTLIVISEGKSWGFYGNGKVPMLDLNEPFRWSVIGGQIDFKDHTGKKTRAFIAARP